MKHNWEYKRLGDIGKIITGSTPSTAVEDYYSSADYMFVKPGDIDGGKISLLKQSETYISEFAFNTTCRKLPKYSILVTCIGIIGKVGILDEVGVCNQQINAIIPNDSINHKYLAYSILSINGILNSQRKGPVVPIINKSQFSNFSIPVPPKEVQQQIVAELDQINDLIAKNRELLSQLNTLAQSLFYDTFGDPITNPKGWSMKKLSDECIDIVDGDHSAPPKATEGVPFITISNIDKYTNSIDFSNSFFVPQSYYDGLKNNRKARNGDVLYTVTGSYGITVLIENQPDFCFQRHIGLLRPKHTLNSVFLAHWGRSSAIKSYADKVATGIAQKTVSLTSLRNFPLILPPLALQEDFAAKVEAIEAQKAKVEAEIAELQTLLEARMDYWFN